MLLALVLLQSAPDIEFNANVRARSVTIEKQGNASLSVRSDPPGTNVTEVQAPRANGRKTLRNVEVNVRAEARIGDPQAAPQNNSAASETAPQS